MADSFDKLKDVRTQAGMQGAYDKGKPADIKARAAAESKAANQKKNQINEQINLSAKLQQIVDDTAAKVKEQGFFMSMLTGETNLAEKSAAALKESIATGKDLTEDMVNAMAKNQTKSAALGGVIQDLAPGLTSMAKGAQTFGLAMSTALGPIGLIIAGIMVLYKVISDVAKKVTETRREFGLSAKEAIRLEASFKVMAALDPFSGLTGDDIKESFKAITDDLGGTRAEAEALSKAVAKTSVATGMTASQTTSLLSAMESVSSESREALLSQMKVSASILEQQGLNPAQVFADMAGEMEHFASFAKDGGGNVLKAAAAAKKLGLNMSAVASSTSALLNFEDSIEKQLTASLLIGRELNLDKARQLALSGDQAGMMEEILKQVGGQAEFEKMNALQRQALADSVGQSVENLSRMVKVQKDGVKLSTQRDTGAAADNQLTALNNIAANTSAGGAIVSANKETGGFLSKFVKGM